MSVGGDLLALAALALNQLTGSSVYQGVAAVLIALVMIRVSLRLISRSHDFLVGAWTGAADDDPQGLTAVTQWRGDPLDSKLDAAGQWWLGGVGRRE